MYTYCIDLLPVCNLVATEYEDDPNVADNVEVDAAWNWTSSSLPKSIAFTANSDPGALNRAEWIKFMSLFFNKVSKRE